MLGKYEDRLDLDVAGTMVHCALRGMTDEEIGKILKAEYPGAIELAAKQYLESEAGALIKYDHLDGIWVEDGVDIQMDPSSILKIEHLENGDVKLHIDNPEKFWMRIDFLKGGR